VGFRIDKTAVAKKIRITHERSVGPPKLWCQTYQL
jgi:hypothetical protein